MARPRNPETDEIIQLLGTKMSVRSVAAQLGLQEDVVKSVYYKHYDEVMALQKTMERREKAEEIKAQIDAEKATGKGGRKPKPANVKPESVINPAESVNEAPENANDGREVAAAEFEAAIADVAPVPLLDGAYALIHSEPDAAAVAESAPEEEPMPELEIHEDPIYCLADFVAGDVYVRVTRRQWRDFGKLFLSRGGIMPVLYPFDQNSSCQEAVFRISKNPLRLYALWEDALIPERRPVVPLESLIDYEYELEKALRMEIKPEPEPKPAPEPAPDTIAINAEKSARTCFEAAKRAMLGETVPLPEPVQLGPSSDFAQIWDDQVDEGSRELWNRVEAKAQEMTGKAKFAPAPKRMKVAGYVGQGGRTYMLRDGGVQILGLTTRTDFSAEELRELSDDLIELLGILDGEVIGA